VVEDRAQLLLDEREQAALIKLRIALEAGTPIREVALDPDDASYVLHHGRSVLIVDA